MKWQYKRITLTPNNTQAHLDALGDEGWELVGFDFGMTFFKRPKPEDPDPKEKRSHEA
jgi:hypothetical protein